MRSSTGAPPPCDRALTPLSIPPSHAWARARALRSGTPQTLLRPARGHVEVRARMSVEREDHVPGGGSRLAWIDHTPSGFDGHSPGAVAVAYVRVGLPQAVVRSRLERLEHECAPSAGLPFAENDWNASPPAGAAPGVDAIVAKPVTRGTLRGQPQQNQRPRRNAPGGGVAAA